MFLSLALHMTLHWPVLLSFGSEFLSRTDERPVLVVLACLIEMRSWLVGFRRGKDAESAECEEDDDVQLLLLLLLLLFAFYFILFWRAMVCKGSKVSLLRCSYWPRVKCNYRGNDDDDDDDDDDDNNNNNNNNSNIKIYKLLQ